MGKKEPEFSVGYGKPPQQTRFKPGQSGNPSGRPRKKSATIAESMARELNTFITVNEGGKQRRIRKLDAIAKQQTNKAAQGDPKATRLVIEAVEPRQVDLKDNLSPVLQEMRAIHRKHELANHNGTRAAAASDLTGDAANRGADHDYA